MVNSRKERKTDEIPRSPADHNKTAPVGERNSDRPLRIWTVYVGSNLDSKASDMVRKARGEIVQPSARTPEEAKRQFMLYYDLVESDMKYLEVKQGRIS